MDLLEEIMLLCKDIFEDDNLKPESKIEDAEGFDSMNLVQLIIELETNFNIEINDDEVKRTLTFAELADKLQEKVNK